MTVKFDTRLFQVFVLKNDSHQSVCVDEVEEVDLAEIKKHLEKGDSIFITSREEKKSLMVEEFISPNCKRKVPEESEYCPRCDKKLLTDNKAEEVVSSRKQERDDQGTINENGICDPPSKFFRIYNCEYHRILYLLRAGDPEVVCTLPK